MRTISIIIEDRSDDGVTQSMTVVDKSNTYGPGAISDQLRTVVKQTEDLLKVREENQ